MKAIICKEPGPADVMTIGEIAKPEPAADEIRIHVAYAGVNRPDLMQRAGLYPAPANASPILGLECAGWVDAVGENVNFEIGEAVCALLPGGGYAEYAIVKASHALPVPSGLQMAQAAVLPEAFFTVWTNVFDRAQLKSGEKFLVHGGASGIGTTAIQMARIWGAQVWTTAGSDEKCVACEKLGAKAINYHDTDFLDYFKSEGHQIDVILDMVGGDYIAKNIQTLATEGRLVNIAYQKGSKAEINFMRVMLKRLTLSGSTLRTRSDAAKTQIATDIQKHFWPAISKGEFIPIIDRIFPLEQAAQAHQYLDSGRHIGKIVLKVSGEE